MSEDVIELGVTLAHVLGMLGAMNGLESVEVEQRSIGVLSRDLVLGAVLEVDVDVVRMSQLAQLVLNVLSISLLAGT